MKQSTLQRKTPLRAKTGLKSNSSLKTYSTLKTYSSLKPKKSLRDSYAEKVKSGEKKVKKTYQKAYKPCVEYFSVFTSDLDTCYISGDCKEAGAPIEIHHIFGAANKNASERYGFIIPLRSDWHTLASYSIHQDMKLNVYYKRKCQQYWLEHYGTKEQFIAEFGKWW